MSGVGVGGSHIPLVIMLLHPGSGSRLQINSDYIVIILIIVLVIVIVIIIIIVVVIVVVIVVAIVINNYRPEALLSMPSLSLFRRPY